LTLSEGAGRGLDRMPRKKGLPTFTMPSFRAASERALRMGGARRSTDG
jgi:hypothetical protein